MVKVSCANRPRVFGYGSDDCIVDAGMILRIDDVIVASKSNSKPPSSPHGMGGEMGGMDM